MKERNKVQGEEGGREREREGRGITARGKDCD